MRASCCNWRTHIGEIGWGLGRLERGRGRRKGVCQKQKEAKRREKDTERLTQKILKGDIRFLEVNSEVRAES